MSKIIIKQLVAMLLMTFILSAVPTDNNASKALEIALKKNPKKILKNIPQKKFLKTLYRQNHYQALWIQSGQLNQKKYTQLFQQIEQDITLNHEGMLYKNYQILSKHVDGNFTQEQLLHTELKLSSVYYNFLIHAIYGEIEWKNFTHKLSALKKKK